MVITAVEEFKKNSDLKEEDLKHIKEWVSKQPHLPQNIPDETLILIMHSCYFSLEMSKHTIDNYFTLRTHIPEFFTQRNPRSQELCEISQTAYCFPLEGRTKEGYKVILGGLRRTDPQYYNFANNMKMMNMVIDTLLQREGTLPGLVIIVNFTGLRLGHIARLHLPIMKKTLVYLQEGTPVRLKGLHYINVVPFIDKVVALMKPFMKKELMDLLTLHSEGSSTVYDIISQEQLPNDLGGKAGEINQLSEQAVNHIAELYDSKWFENDEKTMRVEETKRPGKAKTAGDIFGLDGSFRKLAVD